MMAVIKKSGNNKYWQGCGKIGILHTAGGKVNGASTLENSWAVPQMKHAKRNKIIHLYKNFCINVYWSTIHNS